MPDYRLFFDATTLSAHHLQGNSHIVIIEKWVAGTLGRGSKKERKPVLYLKGKKLPFVVNKTNGAIIKSLYGKNIDDWVGKAIEIYPTTTKFGPDTVDCIRVKPKQPTGKPSAPDADDTQITDDEAAEIARQEANSQ